VPIVSHKALRSRRIAPKAVEIRTGSMRPVEGKTIVRCDRCQEEAELLVPRFLGYTCVNCIANRDQGLRGWCPPIGELERDWVARRAGK